MSQYDILDMIDDGIVEKKEDKKSKIIKHNITTNDVIDMDSSQDNQLSISSSIKLNEALNELKNDAATKNVANLTITTDLKNKKKG